MTYPLVPMRSWDFLRRPLDRVPRLRPGGHAAGDVVEVREAMALEGADHGARAKSACAYDRLRALGRQLLASLHRLQHGHVQRAGDVPLRPLRRLAHVDDVDLVPLVDPLLELVHAELRHRLD